MTDNPEVIRPDSQFPVCRPLTKRKELVLPLPTPSKRLPFGIRGVIPASELKRHGHACITEFICNSAVDQRPSDNHSAYAQSRDRLSPCMTGPFLSMRLRSKTLTIALNTLSKARFTFLLLRAT